MYVFAIRNKVTGLFLSSGKAKARTSAKFSKNPRLFGRKSDAINAMKCWAAGRWRVHIDYEGEADTPSPPDKPPADRKLEELEIVSSNVQWLTHV